ncbi:MAG TPA: vWA domain-containing protein, partial [Candidatus Binatia bacterium]|nr:vWA domain-containing protein [Candidatus Binatia bacterium]
GAEEFSREAAHLRFVKVDGGQDNVGIVGFEVRRHPDRATQYEVMVNLKNFTPKTVRVPLILTLGEQMLVQDTIEIPADGRRVLIYPIEGTVTGTLLAHLEIKDDFATDNRAYLALSDAPELRLLYVGPGNPFLSNLLRFFPHVQVTALERWESAAPQPESRYDVVIFDRVAAPALTHGNFILINTVAPNLPLQLQGKVKNPRIVSPVIKHPITEGVTLGDLHVEEAARVTATSDGVVLARSAESPLLLALERGKLRLLFIGFDLMASDLPLRVAFPVLFHNTLEWFHPKRLEFPAQNVQAATPFILRLPASDTNVEVTSPEGKKQRLEAATSPLLFADTMQVGLYNYKSPSREGLFAVNLFDESESSIVSHVNLSSAKAGDGESKSIAAGDSRFSLWPMLLAGVLIVLAAELFLAFRTGISPYPIALRACAFAALIAALLNPRLFQATSALDVVLGVDLSRSVGQEGREKAHEILEVAGRLRSSDTRTGLVVFGKSPEWEFLPRRELPAADLASRLDREETDIQAALQAALAQTDEGRQSRILLLSDGNENRGDSARVLPLLRAQGAQVWTLPVSLSRGRNEIYLSDLSLPREVDSAEGFEVKGRVESLREAPARIKLLRDGALASEQEIRLNSGTNSINFRQSLAQRGSHTYELLVESAEDTLAENNLLQGVVQVKGPPRVLLISGQRESQRFLSRVLQVQGYAVVESAPEANPLTLPELSSFDLLVLDNVPAFRLS